MLKETINQELLEEFNRQEKETKKKKEKRKKSTKQTRTVESRETVNGGYDYYGDPKAALNGKLYGSLCYYFIDEDNLKQYGTAYNSVLVPPVDSVQSLFYCPYYKSTDFNLMWIDFDSDRFPLDKNITVKGKVRRILTCEAPKKTLGTFSLYHYGGRSISVGGDFHWSKEGKLWQFPFTKSQIYDGLMSPLDFYPSLYTKGSKTAEINVSQPLNNYGTYSLYIPGYKGDTGGTIEGLVNSNSKNLPLSSNAYVNYMSSNQAQIEAQRKTNNLTTGLTVAGSLIGLGASAVASGGLSIPVVLAAAGTSGGALINNYKMNQQLLAQEQDLKNTQDTAKDASGDILFNVGNAETDLQVLRYQQQEQWMERIGWHFHLFGYAQNKVMVPDLRNRYFYNFIKTAGANIKGEGIPKDHLKKLKSIFDNGTTIWHMDRLGVSIGSFSKDNYEV